MSSRVFVRQLGFIHIVLSILSIVYGIKCVSNPHSVFEIFPQCGGDVEAFENACNKKDGPTVPTPTSLPPNDDKESMIKILGVSLVIFGIILGFLDLHLCFGQFQDEDYVKFLKLWLISNIGPMVVYTLGSMFLMFFNSNKVWIQVTELSIYSLNLIIILLVAGFTLELMEEEKKEADSDTDIRDSHDLDETPEETSSTSSM